MPLGIGTDVVGRGGGWNMASIVIQCLSYQKLKTKLLHIFVHQNWPNNPFYILLVLMKLLINNHLQFPWHRVWQYSKCMLCCLKLNTPILVHKILFTSFCCTFVASLGIKNFYSVMGIDIFASNTFPIGSLKRPFYVIQSQQVPCQ